MSIIASAPVPARNRLIDADTADLAAIRRPDPADLGRRVDQLLTAGDTAGGKVTPQLAAKLGVTVDQATAAHTAYVDDLGRRAWKLATQPDATFSAVAAQLGISPADALGLSLAYISRQAGWEPGTRREAAASLPGDPALCPAWCTADHTEDGAERMHHSDVGEVIALAGDDMHEQKFVGVEVESFESPSLPGGIDPATIYLTMGDQAGNQTESAAYLTPELAEQLAAALFQAARLARQARR